MVRKSSPSDKAQPSPAAVPLPGTPVEGVEQFQLPIEPLAPPPRPYWRRELFQPRVLFRLAGWLFVGLAMYRAMDLTPDLSHRQEYLVGPEHVRVTPLPRWIPNDLIVEAFHAIEAEPRLSLLDTNVNARLAEVFRSHPWVADVRTIRKSFPTQIDIELDYRRPVAMVRVPQGLYPVDYHGVLLPPTDFDPAVASEYPMVLGVLTPPRGGPGQEWGEPLVLQGAALATELAPHWKHLKLEAIVCPRTMADPFVLQSVGTRILWGRAPGIEDLAEPTTKQKIGRLLKYANDFGGFDQPRGPYEIDIRHFKSISRRPLLQADIQSRRTTLGLQ